MPTAHRDPVDPDMESTAGDTNDVNDADTAAADDGEQINAAAAAAAAAAGNDDHDPNDDCSSSCSHDEGSLGELEVGPPRAPFPLRRLPTGEWVGGL